VFVSVGFLKEAETLRGPLQQPSTAKNACLKAVFLLKNSIVCCQNLPQHLFHPRIREKRKQRLHLLEKKFLNK
jgi:hypothetical protein